MTASEVEGILVLVCCRNCQLYLLASGDLSEPGIMSIHLVTFSIIQEMILYYNRCFLV